MTCFNMAATLVHGESLCQRVLMAMESQIHILYSVNETCPADGVCIRCHNLTQLGTEYCNGQAEPAQGFLKKLKNWLSFSWDGKNFLEA